MLSDRTHPVALSADHRETHVKCAGNSTGCLWFSIQNQPGRRPVRLLAPEVLAIDVAVSVPEAAVPSMIALVSVPRLHWPATREDSPGNGPNREQERLVPLRMEMESHERLAVHQDVNAIIAAV